MKLTQQAAQALAALRGSPEFGVVLEWLKENREAYRDECCTLPPEKVQRSQGKVEAVNAFFKAVDSAPGVLEKFKSNQR